MFAISLKMVKTMDEETRKYNRLPEPYYSPTELQSVFMSFFGIATAFRYAYYLFTSCRKEAALKSFENAYESTSVLSYVAPGVKNNEILNEEKLQSVPINEDDRICDYSIFWVNPSLTVPTNSGYY